MKIEIEIKSCRNYPFFKEERVYTADSWETIYNWFCTKDGNKNKIQGYVEWHEENNIEIPEWCPAKSK